MEEQKVLQQDVSSHSKASCEAQAQYIDSPAATDGLIKTSISSFQSEVQSDDIKRCLINVLDRHCSDLEVMSEPKIQSLAKGMFSKALITEPLLQSPTFKDIIEHYKSTFDQIPTPDGVLEHFDKFLTVFEGISGRGGYYVLAAIGLKADANQELRATLNITHDVFKIENI